MRASVLFPVFLVATAAAAQSSAVLPIKLANAPGSSLLTGTSQANVANVIRITY